MIVIDSGQFTAHVFFTKPNQRTTITYKLTAFTFMHPNLMETFTMRYSLFPMETDQGQ